MPRAFARGSSTSFHRPPPSGAADTWLAFELIVVAATAAAAAIQYGTRQRASAWAAWRWRAAELPMRRAADVMRTRRAPGAGASPRGRRRRRCGTLAAGYDEPDEHGSAACLILPVAGARARRWASSHALAVQRRRSSKSPRLRVSARPRTRLEGVGRCSGSPPASPPPPPPTAPTLGVARRRPSGGVSSSPATYRALSPALRRRRAGRLLDAYESWLAAAESSAWRSAALCGVILEQPNRRLKAALGRWAALLQRRELAAVCDEAAAVRELVHYWLQWRDWWAARLRVATSAEAGKVLCAWRRATRRLLPPCAHGGGARGGALARESARRAAGLLRTVRGWRHWVREWQGVRRRSATCRWVSPPPRRRADQSLDLLAMLRASPPRCA